MRKLSDIASMPGWNPSTSSRGDHSVSEGQVTWTEKNKVTCKTHGAMLCVSEDRKLWRCIACGAGAYLTFTPKPTEIGVMPKVCDNPECEGEAQYQFHMSNMDGEVLDFVHYCKECSEEVVDSANFNPRVRH